MATTIRDIARMGGVCIGTVSRVINDKDKVHPETRQKILALIEKTGYRPSAVGRALALRCSHTIHLHVTDISDPYYARLCKLTSENCRARGYQMQLSDSNFDPAVEAERLRRCRDSGVDGLLVSPLPSRANLPLYRDLVRNRFPLVIIDNDVPGSGAWCVKYDDYAAARTAMDYLFGKGHRRVAFIGWRTEFQTVQDRIRGYRESHRRHGIAVDEDLLVTLPGALQTAELGWLEALLRRRRPPTALFAENEILSVVCMNALVRRGKRIPEDVAVIGIGDALIDQLVPVPLTTVSLRQEEACRRAVRLLLDLIEHPALRRRPPRRDVVKPQLIARDSA